MKLFTKYLLVLLNTISSTISKAGCCCEFFGGSKGTNNKTSSKKNLQEERKVFEDKIKAEREKEEEENRKRAEEFRKKIEEQKKQEEEFRKAMNEKADKIKRAKEVRDLIIQERVKMVGIGIPFSDEAKKDCDKIYKNTDSDPEKAKQDFESLRGRVLKEYEINKGKKNIDIVANKLNQLRILLETLESIYKKIDLEFDKKVKEAQGSLKKIKDKHEIKDIDNLIKICSGLIDEYKSLQIDHVDKYNNLEMLFNSVSRFSDKYIRKDANFKNIYENFKKNYCKAINHPSLKDSLTNEEIESAIKILNNLKLIMENIDK